MSKAERLIEMMITINAKRDFTVGELAKEFSVSKRTILRDLQELEQAGFPLYAEVGAAGGYHIESGAVTYTCASCRWRSPGLR